MKNRFIIIAILFMLFLILIQQMVFAENELVKLNIGAVESLKDEEVVPINTYKEHINNNVRRNKYLPYQDIPELTIDEITEWFNRKLFEIVYFLQTLAQPFTITIYICSAFILLVGSIGRGDLAGKGILGLIVSPVVYSLILYAPLILQGFLLWLDH